MLKFAAALLVLGSWFLVLGLLSSVFCLLSLSSFRAVDADAAERLGERFEEVVEFVADGADVESGGGGDGGVTLALAVFEVEQAGIFGREFGYQQAQGADGLVAAEFGVGVLAGIRLVGRLDVARQLAPVVAAFVEREVADAAVEPGPRVLDVLPIAVQAEEGLLDHVLRDLPSAEQAESVAQQRTFLAKEQVR